MNGFGVFVIICVLLYCSISWLVPRVLAWLCKRRLRVEVRVGRIALPSLKLRDVSVRSSGFSVHVDEIGLRSSVFGGEESKLLAVVVKELRVNKDISSSVPSASTAGRRRKDARKAPLDLRGARLPPALLSLAQFMALHIQGATVMLLHARGPAPWLVHAAAAELRLDGSVVQGARALLVSLAVRGASAKLLRHAPPSASAAAPSKEAHGGGRAGSAGGGVGRPREGKRQSVPSYPGETEGGGGAAGACLGEAALGAALEATLVARGPLSVERLYVAVERTRAVLHEGLASFLTAPAAAAPPPPDVAAAAASFHREREEEEEDEGEEEHVAAALEDALQRFGPVVPKSLQVRVEETVVTGARSGAGRPELRAALRRLLLSSQCPPTAPAPGGGGVRAPAAPQPPAPAARLLGVGLTPPPPPPLPSPPAQRLRGAPPPQLFVTAELDGLSVRCGRDPAALELSRLLLEAQLEEGSLAMLVELDTLRAVYEHAALRPWFSALAPAPPPSSYHGPASLPPMRLPPVQQRNKQKRKSRGPGLLRRLLGPVQVRGAIRASGVSALARLPEPEPGSPAAGAPRCASVCCASARLDLEPGPASAAPSRESVLEGPAPAIKWTAELRVEQLGCALGEAAAAAAEGAECAGGGSGGGSPVEALGRGRFHTWGAPLTLAAFSARLRKEEVQKESDGALATSLRVTADGLRLELSPELSAAALQALRCLEADLPRAHRSQLHDQPLLYSSAAQRLEPRVEHATEAADTEGGGLKALLSKAHLTASLANANVFLLADAHGAAVASGPDARVCVCLRVDTLSLERARGRLSAAAEGVKALAPAKGPRAAFACLRAADASGGVAHVRRLRLTARLPQPARQGQLQLHLLDDVEISWSCALHLRLLSLLRELRNFRESLPASFRRPPAAATPAPAAPGPDVTASASAAAAAAAAASEAPEKAGWAVSIRAQGRLSASACAGPRRPAAALSAQEVSVSWAPGEWACASPSLALAVDGAELFGAQGLDLRSLKDSAEVRLERRNADGFTLAWNERTWAITLASFKAVFPYEHRFAEVFQNELMSVLRWVRNIHRRPASAPRPPSRLPPDLVIKVREFLFEMSDDPFEVRLRDNFELLEDEYKESARRQKMLDAKVAELCKQHLLLPSGKVEELYASLNKKNAQIYVQRSQQMARTAPPRTRLFAWQITTLEVLALSDPAISLPPRAAACIAAMDSEAPAPEGGLRLQTLWCRAVSVSCAEWAYQLRDFPQPLLHIRGLRLWGRVAGAEQEAPPRARRTVVLHLSEPWGDVKVERTMTSLKFYHDLNCDVDLYSYAFGPCWEPVIAQCNLSFEKIVQPSRDPSPPLPFWDKMRLLLHGRLTMCVRQLTVLLHASLDPYNTTEEMELTWRDVAMDWTNAKVVFKGELNVYVRTASKYDDCRLLHLPNLRLTLKLQWVCLGDPNDHHAVFPCAPDKLPEYSSNQEHDSFRAFRSQNLNLSVALETKPLQPVNRAGGAGGNGAGAATAAAASVQPDLDCPVVLLYGSTLRWFENLKLILSGVTRPTRRGAVWGQVRPRKQQLSRHYRRLHLLLGLHRFHVFYWMSSAMQRGCELLGGRISCSSEHTLTLVPVDDGLKHRPRADWAVAYMNCELNDAEIWLKSALQQLSGADEDQLQQGHGALRPPVEKCYCLSVAKVSYGREALLPAGGDTPIHRLVVYDLKGAWTKSNRDVAFALFDAFRKTKQLKKNLSTEALKGFRAEPANTPAKRTRSATGGTGAPAAGAEGSTTTLAPGAAADPTATAAGVDPAAGTAAGTSAAQAAPSPLSKLQSGVAASMLQRLIAEADNKAVVFSDDPSAAPGEGAGEPQLLGRAACREDDALHKNWLIALVNSQVLLKGCETKGYVILSAAKAEILQRVHRPVWKAHRTPVSKTTWVGSLDCMQYYATVAAGDADALDDNIMWLSVENIQERQTDATDHISELPDVPHLVGSGRSVGGVVSETVGASAAGGEGGYAPLQLQRIVSRCRCEFFYACYGESSVDPAAAAQLPPPPPAFEEPDLGGASPGGGPWERHDPAVDAFTLMHHDLEVCTNSLQYAMVLDVVNNLLLYVEPRRKEASARLQRMRFQLQLHSVEDQRRPIQQLQNKVRSLVSKLRRLERESYLLERAAAEIEEDGTEEAYHQEMIELDRQINECKEQLNAHSEELDMMISCYKETQLTANQKLATMRGDKPVTIVRANEIVFKHAQWRLTQADGQLGIADLVLSNFLYTKNSKSDDSGEHLLEIGYVRMTNLLPNQVYTEVLSPTEIQSNMPVDRKRAVRVFCREKAPVGGISVKEHFEINVVPITIGLTKKFFNTMLKFCFPERDPDTIEGEGSEDLETEGKGKKGKKGKSKEASFYVPIDPKDDVEKMKERAEKNKLFIYIKIPEVPVKVSYKGNKDKNLEDIRDFSLVIPTLEYHNVTWTWLDLLLAMKSDSRRVILSQAIKQKLQIKMPRAASDDSASPQEEDKARMLFGTRLMERW